MNNTILIIPAIIIFLMGILMGVIIAYNLFEVELNKQLLKYRHDQIMEDLKEYL